MIDKNLIAEMEQLDADYFELWKQEITDEEIKTIIKNHNITIEKEEDDHFILSVPIGANQNIIIEGIDLKDTILKYVIKCYEFNFWYGSSVPKVKTENSPFWGLDCLISDAC